MRPAYLIAGSIMLVLALAGGFGFAETNLYPTREKLGEALFHDTNLSMNRKQACATCHMPERGFSDRHDVHKGNAVSLGDDGKSFGDRNAPTATYAALSPPFQKNAEGLYVGGQFWDGRARTL